MKSPISGSTVSLQVCLDASGCKGVAGLAPTHLQLLGERKMKRERGREKGEREREGQKDSWHQGFQGAGSFQTFFLWNYRVLG